MGTILLKLAGPLQSWGSDSRYTERKTRHEPTKSGVIGLLAAALGRGREDSIEDLAGLHFGVRVDQGGVLVRDYQTSHTRKYDKDTRRWVFEETYITNRYYLADAVFVAGIEVPDGSLAEYSDALLHPAFPLYLGRRSCPPSGKVLLASFPGVGLRAALARQPWQATSRKLVMKHASDERVTISAFFDSGPLGKADGRIYEDVHDAPISFSKGFRQYGWRRVLHETIHVPNPYCVHPDHDPFAALEEVE